MTQIIDPETNTTIHYYYDVYKNKMDKVIAEIAWSEYNSYK